MASRESFTQLLIASRTGEAAALDALLPQVYDELRAMARRYLGRESAGVTLQPTALVHEVYLRLVDQDAATPADRGHFQALCAQVMRRVLVDQARRRNAHKRGQGRGPRLETDFDPAAPEGTSALDLLALDEALQAFEKVDARRARVVELRVFAGLGTAQAADVLGVSERTVEADWFLARAWLRAALGEGS